MNRTIFICIALTIAISSCKSRKESTKEVPTYKMTSAVLMDTSVTQEYVAQLQSIQNIEIRAKVKGYLESINADEGQMVNAGQLLFTIRPREYEAELMKARAEVKAAELEVQNTRVLSEKDIVSKNELETALAKLDQAKAEQALAELYVSYTRISAPFTGTIDRLKLKTGSLIDEGALLTTLSNNREIYAYFNVSEQEYLNYKMRDPNDRRNDAVLILANNLPHKYKGQVETIESEFDNTTGSIQFRARFPNPELLLKHGETGKVQLRIPLHHALIIPQKATYEMQDKAYVFVVDAQNIVHSRQINIRQKLSNIYVVDEGITAEDKILLDGIQYVKDDDKVKTEFVPGEKALNAFNNN